MKNTVSLSPYAPRFHAHLAATQEALQPRGEPRVVEAWCKVGKWWEIHSELKNHQWISHHLFGVLPWMRGNHFHHFLRCESIWDFIDLKSILGWKVAQICSDQHKWVPENARNLPLEDRSLGPAQESQPHPAPMGPSVAAWETLPTLRNVGCRRVKVGKPGDMMRHVHSMAQHGTVSITTGCGAPTEDSF